MDLKYGGFNRTYLNTFYSLNNEHVKIENSKLLFSNFTFRDTLGATAVLNGYIAPDPKHTVAFDLTLETKKFLAINSVRSDTAQFYGKVILDSYTKVTGNKDFPKVDANI